MAETTMRMEMKNAAGLKVFSPPLHSDEELDKMADFVRKNNTPRPACPPQFRVDECTTLSRIAEVVHEMAKEKGWWGDPDAIVPAIHKPPDARLIPEKIALMHSELSEALEEYRVEGLKNMIYGEVAPHHGHPSKPEGLAVELADLLIRLLDTCEGYKIPLLEALEAKIAYNATRPFRHGNKRC